MSSPSALLSVRDLKVHFKLASESPWPWEPSRALKAVDGVSFDIFPGETLGIVGESGCGKSTLGRCLAGLEKPETGELLWRGQAMSRADDRTRRARRIQMVFQDPYASLNPRMSLGAMLEEALLVHGIGTSTAERRDRLDALLEMVGSKLVGKGMPARAAPTRLNTPGGEILSLAAMVPV